VVKAFVQVHVADLEGALKTCEMARHTFDCVGVAKSSMRSRLLAIEAYIQATFGDVKGALQCCSEAHGMQQKLCLLETSMQADLWVAEAYVRMVQGDDAWAESCLQHAERVKTSCGVYGRLGLSSMLFDVSPELQALRRQSPDSAIAGS